MEAEVQMARWSMSEEEFKQQQKMKRLEAEDDIYCKTFPIVNIRSYLYSISTGYAHIIPICCISLHHLFIPILVLSCLGVIKSRHQQIDLFQPSRAAVSTLDDLNRW